MKILITGNLGYVGSVLTSHLREYFEESYLIGYDTGYFAHSITGANFIPEKQLDLQYYNDIRLITNNHLKDVDAVVHLSAISNDPMGNKFERPTEHINSTASIDLIRKSIQSGVNRFVFASSCSMYGSASESPRKETDTLNPLTAYARSKASTEKYMQDLILGDSIFTSLRFSTACGMSPRLRLDLVLNDFVACALTSRKITVLSNGSPWRPLIDVNDMATAIIWALRRDASENLNYLSINVGRTDSNYQIKDLANTVADLIPGTSVDINKNAETDNRSYKVDFSLYSQLASGFQPSFSLENSIVSLIDGLKSMKFDNHDFRSSQYIRLKALQSHMDMKRLNKELYWR